MGGKSNRLKGQRGERELAELLYYATGELLTRNLDQVRDGGADLIGIDGLSIEVKRQETLSRNTWWKQTLRQAEEKQETPVLAYRQNRKVWRFEVGFERVPMSFVEFIFWLRKFLADSSGIDQMSPEIRAGQSII